MRSSTPSRPGLRALLATSSVAALLIGGGTPAAYAAACNDAGISLPFDNPLNTTIQNVCVVASFTAPGSNITNEGSISPSGIAFVGGTINGSVLSAGVINGGISLRRNQHDQR